MDLYFPTEAVAETPVNPITSAVVKLPTEVVDETPVKFCTADPNPTKEPKVNSACIPDNNSCIIWHNHRTYLLVVIPNPVKSASCEVTPAAVPCDEVIACPVGDTSSFGATAVPCATVDSCPVNPMN